MVQIWPFLGKNAQNLSKSVGKLAMAQIGLVQILVFWFPQGPNGIRT